MTKQDVLWDFMYHTSDRGFSGIGRVLAPSEKEALNEVKKNVLEMRPDVTIRLIRVEKSKESDSE